MNIMRKNIQVLIQTFSILQLSFFTFHHSVAQVKDGMGAARKEAFVKHTALMATSPYKNLHWKNVGPDNLSGRCTEVQGIPGNRNVIYASFATGGFWKTEDGGETWKPLTDMLGTQSIGCFALAPSNNNIIYLGTGEANIFRASLPGMGAYKSVDGGKTWNAIGLTNTSTIARLIVHPTDANTVYAAAGGNEWSYNNDRGLYKTTDGGKTWNRILGNDEKTGAIDVVMDPSDPNTLIVSTWNRIRRRWSDPIPEDGDHVYKTTDGGKHGASLKTDYLQQSLAVALDSLSPKAIPM